MHPRLRGLIAAPHTPMYADTSLHLAMIERQAEHLLRNGVKGVFIAGSTGEGLSLTVDERQALAERWSDVTRGTDLRVIVHVGHNCQADAVALARHAATLTVHGIAALAPFYYKPAGVTQLLDFLVPVAAAVPEVPFYFYDIPILTGVQLPMVDFLTQGQERIPNLQGIKYTNGDLMQFQQCVQFDQGKFDILFGCDESLLAALALGAEGAVGSSYNYAAPLYHAVIDAYKSGDMATARAQQVRSVELIRTIAEYGYAAAAKMVMSFLGIDCGPARSPLRNLTEEESSTLRRRLDTGGYLSFY